jgi:hypothetical protein
MKRVQTSSQTTAENEAWRLVCARESGERYLSKTEMARQAGISPRKVDAMIGRFRVMRKAGIEIDRQDWWTARLTPMPAAA